MAWTIVVRFGMASTPRQSTREDRLRELEEIRRRRQGEMTGWLVAGPGGVPYNAAVTSKPPPPRTNREAVSRIFTGRTGYGVGEELAAGVKWPRPGAAVAGAGLGAAGGAGVGFGLGGPPGAAIGSGIGAAAGLLGSVLRTPNEDAYIPGIVTGRGRRPVYSTVPTEHGDESADQRAEPRQASAVQESLDRRAVIEEARAQRWLLERAVERLPLNDPERDRLVLLLKQARLRERMLQRATRPDPSPLSTEQIMDSEQVNRRSMADQAIRSMREAASAYERNPTPEAAEELQRLTEVARQYLAELERWDGPERDLIVAERAERSRRWAERQRAQGEEARRVMEAALASLAAEREQEAERLRRAREIDEGKHLAELSSLRSTVSASEAAEAQNRAAETRARVEASAAGTYDHSVASGAASTVRQALDSIAAARTPERDPKSRAVIEQADGAVAALEPHVAALEYIARGSPEQAARYARELLAGQGEAYSERVARLRESISTPQTAELVDRINTVIRRLNALAAQ